MPKFIGDKMEIRFIHRAIAPLLLTLFLLTACGTTAPPPVDMNTGSSAPAASNVEKTAPTSPPPAPQNTTAPKEVTSPGKTSSMKDIAGLPPQKGSAFNKFFPNVKGSGYEMTFAQEKEGFAEVKIVKGGKEVAKISISDTVTNLTARTKFEGVTDKVAGFPVMNQGKNASAVLVGDRYQVKVMSKDLMETDRKQWLEKVNLKGLAAL